MSAASPLVSVVVPTWNGQPFLREALGSVARQSYRHFELIVVDDGSTDESPWIAAELAGVRPEWLVAPVPGLLPGTLVVWRRAFETVGPFSRGEPIASDSDWLMRAVRRATLRASGRPTGTSE